MRECMICRDPITECFGFVLARDFLAAVRGELESKPPRELCGGCGLMLMQPGWMEVFLRDEVA